MVNVWTNDGSEMSEMSTRNETKQSNKRCDTEGKGNTGQVADEEDGGVLR